MAGPWEDYQTPAAPAAGPWDDYKTPPATPAAAPGAPAPNPYSPLGREPTEKFDPFLLESMRGPENEQKRREYLQRTAPNYENRLAGAGQRLFALGQGAGQLGGDVLRTTDWGKQLSESLGLPTRADVEERKQRDLPLTSSPAGKRGALASDITLGALSAPIGAGANIAGRLGIGAGLGAGAGALEPVGINDSRAGNVAVGGLTGLAGQGIGEGIGAGVGALGRQAGRSIGQEAPQIPLTEKQAAQQAMMDKGYTLSPAETTPSTLNRVMEGLAGKAPTSQLAMAKNEANTTRLIKEEFGIPTDEPLNLNTLKAIRSKAGQAYADLKNVQQPVMADPEFETLVNSLGGQTSAINKSFPGLAENRQIEKLKQSLSSPEMTFEASVEAVKRLRRQAGANLKGYDNPDKLELGRAQLEAANGIENLMDRNLKALQMPDLLEQYRNARVTIAKTHDVEEVLGDNGLISTKLLKKRMDNDVPLSGNLADIARAQGTQPRSLRNVQETGGATLSDPLSTMVGLAGGHPGTAVGLPFIRHGAQEAILSPWYQRNFVRPQAAYAQGLTDPYLANLIGRTAPQIPVGQQ